jgi:fucose permease
VFCPFFGWWFGFRAFKPGIRPQDGGSQLFANITDSGVRFLSICGPPKYSEIRLNLAQAVQGVGSMAAPLLASYVFFKNIDDTADGLQQVQWVYLGVACFVVLLAASLPLLGKNRILTLLRSSSSSHQCQKSQMQIWLSWSTK